MTPLCLTVHVAHPTSAAAMLELLHHSGADISSHGGYLRVTRYHRRRERLEASPVLMACRNGELELLKWLQVGNAL